MAQPYAYIFGYGSLIETQSRASTVASALYAQPALVRGVQRGWFDRVMDTTNYTCTFLGAVATSPNILCNGVIYPVSKQDFDAYVARESGYKPTEIKPDALIMLDGTTKLDPSPTNGIWYFANTERHVADQLFPIVQTYVDVCLTGCLQIEATYPLARRIADFQNLSFAEVFIASTIDWSVFWENDRLIPRRPFVYQPKAYAIDQLLNKAPGTKDIYPKIPLAPSRW